MSAFEYIFNKAIYFIDLNINLLKIYSNAIGNIIIGISSSEIYMSEDYGITWISKGTISYLTNTTNLTISNIVYSKNNNVILLLVINNNNKYYLYKTTNFFTTMNLLTLPQTIKNGLFLFDINQDGDKIIVVSPHFKHLYYSNDYGVTWTTKDISNSHIDFHLITSSYNFEYIYLTTHTNNIYISNNLGDSWTHNATGLNNIQSIITNYNGSIIYAACYNNGVFKSIDYGANWTNLNLPISIELLQNPGKPPNSNFTHKYINVTCNNIGNNILVGESSDSNYVYFSNDSGTNWYLQYPLVNYDDLNVANTLVAINGTGDNLYSYVPNYSLYYQINDPPCFAKGTQILCKINDKDIYVLIQDLKIGDLIITTEGVKRLIIIGNKDIYHNGEDFNKNRDKNKLYIYKQSAYPEIFSDLIITGCHSILVDSFKSQKEMFDTIKVNGDLYITHNKIRLPACVDDRAEIYCKSGIYTIYHIALENKNICNNYGIYANGLLVESCSILYLYELSEMKLQMVPFLKKETK